MEKELVPKTNIKSFVSESKAEEDSSEDEDFAAK
jgi:hypothetical protein